VFEGYEDLSDEEFLGTVGTLVDRSVFPPALVTRTRQAALTGVVEALTAKPRRSVLVVGERGVMSAALPPTRFSAAKPDCTSARLPWGNEASSARLFESP
jgi:hypothetical protein